MARMILTPIEERDAAKQASVELVADRFGCEARSDGERRACALYLWLLGPSERNIDCPCRS